MPNARVRHDRTKGIIFLEGAPCVQLDAGQEKADPTKPLWNYAVVSAQNVDKDAPLARFNGISPAAEEIRWQIQQYYTAVAGGSFFSLFCCPILHRVEH
eukprot:2431708-Pyramimonas_sp.AAC.1